MSSLRLFYVLDSLEEDEVGDQVLLLLERLSRSRFEPRVVSLGARGSLGSRLREMKVPVHRLELVGVTGAALAVFRLRKLLRGLHADIVHTFQPWSGAVAHLAAVKGVPVFRWIQGFPPPPSNLEERLQALLERLATRRRDPRLVASDAGAVEEVSRRHRADRVEVVPECLDLGLLRQRVEAVAPHDARVHLGLTEGQRALVAVSDFRDRGRMAQLLEGFATARREEPGLRLFVAGGGPEEGAARWQAEDLRLEDSVIFMGTRQERFAMWRAAEVVVDAGSWPGWSRGAVEAMALELPVVRWVGHEHDHAIERYPARTAGPADRFARDLLGLLDDAELRARVAGQVAGFAQGYDVETVAQRWAEVYGP